MATKKKNTPDFFAEFPWDPVESATGSPRRKEGNVDMKSSINAPTGKRTTAKTKKKAGFYLSADILNRFTLKFHELKLAGVAIDNKSTLLELALCYALDDLDKGKRSRLLKKIEH